MANLQEQLAEANLRRANLQQQLAETKRCQTETAFCTKRMRHTEPFELSRVIASEEARRARMCTSSLRESNTSDSIACEHCCGVGKRFPGCIRLRRGVYARVNNT